jgi:2-dehydro-3-deoxyphosphogluconate aldolase / (4S)-4-hydroxy-2-oxoglutarate aldolase
MQMTPILAAAPVIAVVTLSDPAHAVPLAQALVAGGLPTIEITLRTEAALAAIRLIRTKVPAAIVGAGTVVRAEQISAARHAGAMFLVSPGFDISLAREGLVSRLPYMPAVVTPSEAMAALGLGLKSLKLFPAEASGGVKLIDSFRAPFPELIFCPTGGIGEANYRDYLTRPNVACVGGSWIASDAAIESRNWLAIESQARKVANAPRAWRP